MDGLRELALECGAREVYFNADPDPFGKQVEREVAEMLAGLGVECRSHADVALHGPDEVLTQSGQPYRVYTPYSRNWQGLEKPLPVGNRRRSELRRDWDRIRCRRSNTGA